jgi:hypothetical protein
MHDRFHAESGPDQAEARCRRSADTVEKLAVEFEIETIEST